MTDNNRYTLEDTQLIEIRIENRTDTIVATSKSDNQSTLESALLRIKDLERKFKEANEKLITFFDSANNCVVRRVEKTKKSLLQCIRKLTSQKRLRIEKSLSKSSDITSSFQ